MTEMSLSLDLTARRGAFDLAATASFAPGITAIMGPSGAGKTTLLDLVAGACQPATGTVTLGGRDLTPLPPEQRHVAYVFQDNLLFPHMTVRQNIAFGRTPAASSLHDLMDLFGLGDLAGRSPPSLSGGEQKRVALARALATEPQALLLDEPFAGIDPVRRDSLYPHLLTIRREWDIPILMVTHHLDEALRTADQLLVMDKGRILGFGDLATQLERGPITTALGVNDGTLLEGNVIAVDGGIAHIQCDRFVFKTVADVLRLGDHLRLRILARDVALSLEEPVNTSILNAIPVRLLDMSPIDAAEMDIRLVPDIEGGLTPTPLKARITRASADRLGLVTGQSLHALIKAVAISRHVPTVS